MRGKRKTIQGFGGGGNGARVLVVDDDERNLLALSEVLEPIAEVVCSSSGRDALRQLLRGAPAREVAA